jgi:DNA-directed RNA polymerase beta' subunit
MMNPRITSGFKGDASEIRWSLLSPDEIRQMSVVEVKNPTIYDASTLPRENGINDHRMGTVDRRYPCGTCFHKVETDDGHPGHMELSAPVYHIGFIKSICKILRSVCFLCSKICLPYEYFNGFPQATTNLEDITKEEIVEPDEKEEVDETEETEEAEEIEDINEDPNEEEEEEDEKLDEDDDKMEDDPAESNDDDEPAEDPEVPVEDEAQADDPPADEPPDDLLLGDVHEHETNEEEDIGEPDDACDPDPEEDLCDTKKRKKRKSKGTGAAKKKKGAGKKFQVLKFKKWFDATEGAQFRKDRFRLVTDFVGKMKTVCPHCGGPRPAYNIQNGIFIRQIWKEAEFANDAERKFCKKMFTPFEARAVLTNISAIDCARLGLESRPEYAVSSVLLVPSPVIRPSIAFGDSNRTRGQDDLTNKLQDILKTSLELKRLIESKNTNEDIPWNEDIKKDPLKTYFLLQFHVATYIDNNIPNQRQSLKRNKIPVKSIKQRFVGKGGRIRGNLQGKRVDLSARAPISPDMDQDMTYVGVPREIAQTLTITETVTALNIHALTKRVQIGCQFPNGAKFVIKTKCAETALEDIIEGKMPMDALSSHLSNHNNNKNRKRAQQQYAGKNQLTNDEDLTIDLQFCQQKHLLRLQYGWKVLRYLQNDDEILVNRQPSLRKKSILVHKVRIIEGRTIRLNLSVCSNYNADFDGDEMNLHLCQDLLSRAEYEVMTVSKQLLNAQNNRPGMGLVFDPLLGGYLLTCRDQMFTREQTMNLLNTKKHDEIWDLPIPAILKPKQLWTGKQIFSMLFPEDLNLTVDRRPHKKKSDSFFRDSLKNWSTDEQFIHIRKGELLYGQLAKRELGATAGGIIHLIAKDHNSDMACHFIDNAQSMINYFLAQEGFGVGISDCLMSDADTTQVHALVDLTYQQLSNLYEKASAIGISKEKLEPTVSRLLGNVLEMTGAVAQKNLTDDNGFVVMKNAGSKGSSINLSQIMACVGQNSIDGKRISLGSKRPLPCFDGETEIFESHGFIENSYVRGLTAAEFFYHTMAGREGLSDTAVKTARTGYLQRRLMKSHESLKVVYDQTIRNAENYITSYIYGDDGLDASFLEPVHLFILTWSDSKIKEFYHPDIIETIIRLRDECRFAKVTPMTQELNVTVFLPIHLERLLRISNDAVAPAESKESPLVPSYLHSKLHQLAKEFSSKYGMYQHATLFFRTSLFTEVSTQRLIRDWKWNKSRFDQFIAKVESKFWSCLVQPGEMVGPLAAESIGEPSTQMSVDYKEQLLIQTPKQTEVHTIGQWIDDIIEKNKDSKTLEHKKGTDTWIVDIRDLKVYIPSVNTDGIVSWEHVSGVTRHPPNGKMVQVTTKTKRKVTATLAKSFLTNVKGKVTPTNGSDLKIGMQVPLTRKLDDPHYTRKTTFNMAEVFSKKEIYFGSEIAKARAIYLSGQPWIPAFDIEYQVPCGKDGLRLHLWKQYEVVLKPGIVYPKMFHRSKSTIPEIIPLDHSFGYFIGAYLADGSSSDVAVSISKVNDEFRQPIEELMTRWNLGFRTKAEDREISEGKFIQTTSLIINSTVIAEFVKRICGHLAPNKYVPDFAYGSSKEFIGGLISGYFSGDGSVSENVSASSCSLQLLHGISSLLSQFGIYTKLYEYDGVGQKRKLCGTGHTVITKNVIYSIFMTKRNSHLFAKHFTLTVPQKAEALRVLRTWKPTQPEKDKKNLKADIYWDEIIDLQYIDSSSKYVYDLTVPTTLNFQLWNGIQCVDTLNTFHHAGIASKNVILGVPRITELVDACRKIKTPSLSIYLLKAEDKSGADELKEQLLELFLQDVVTGKDVIYDPNLEQTVIREDQDLVDWFNVFTDGGKEQKDPEEKEKKEKKKKIPNPSSNFVIRLKLDRKLLVKRRLTPQMISERITEYFHAEFSEVQIDIQYSDSNVGPPLDWILRIRCYNLDTLKLLQEEKRGSGRRSVIQSIVQNNAAALLPTGKKNAGNLKPELVKMACRNLLHKIMVKIRISIVPNIKQATLRKVQVSRVDPKNRGMTTDDEYMIDTVGSALLEVMTLPGVDWKRTMSNDVNEVYETMGIEMAAALLFHEMKTVLSYDGTYINDRHIIQIVNTMTFRGYLMPLSRHGINRIDTGPLVRGSFEETPDVLLEAGFFNEVDYINGVTDNITLGQKAPIGTGCVSVHLTKDYVKILKDKIEKTKEVAIQQSKKWNKTSQRLAIPKLIRTRFDRQIPIGSDHKNETYAHRSPKIKPVFISAPVGTGGSGDNGQQIKPKGLGNEEKKQQLAFSKSDNTPKSATVTYSFSSILAQGYPLASAQDRLRRLQSNYVYRPSSPDLTPFQPFPVEHAQAPAAALAPTENKGDLGEFDLSRMLIDIAPYLPKEVDANEPVVISGGATGPPVAPEETQASKIQLYNETTGRINPACVQWLCSGEKD